MDGAPEVIRDGVSGCLVPPRDTAAVAERTLALLGDADRRQAMGDAGREFAKAHFRVETMVQRIDAVYARLSRT
jgi:glycosyltransferase involved in cell wall biosynthesis